MEIMRYLVGSTLYIAIEAVVLCMLVHAIMSWISPSSDNKVMIFIDNIVDLACTPMRSLLDRFDAIKGSPIDLSFLATWFLLIILQGVIGALI